MNQNLAGLDGKDNLTPIGARLRSISAPSAFNAKPRFTLPVTWPASFKSARASAFTLAGTSSMSGNVASASTLQKNTDPTYCWPQKPARKGILLHRPRQLP